MIKKKVKKAQTGAKEAPKADATRVEKPIVKSSIEQPTYKNLKWVGEPTKDDSLSYKKGYFKGIVAKKKGEKNTSNAFGTSAGIRGFQEGYNKNRNGGVTKAKAGKQMIKRADGSVSQRGLWDNIRSAAKKNKATGAKPKAPTKAMLSQEKKIKAKTK